MLTRKRNREIDIEKAPPLSLLFTAQFREIFETHIVPKLRPRSEIKFLKMAFKDARDAVRRADIFEKHIVPKLRPRSDLKFLKMAFKDARDAFRRSKIKVEEKFNISEFTSISQMEFAWDNYRWGENGYEGTQEYFCLKVAQMNKLEYLVWAREVKNCDCDWRTIAFAASQGNLAMVKYCVDNGCPMDEDACIVAASEGHLDVLKYLHENDCPWNTYACFSAHENNRIDCLNYLIEQKCPGFERFLPPAVAVAAAQ